MQLLITPVNQNEHRMHTSDFKSSDFALAESAFFISSSLLIDEVLPFDVEQTAGGAIVTNDHNMFAQSKAIPYVSFNIWKQRGLYLFRM